ncbi:MAG: serine/threonine protein kinase [bacterium]
MAGKIIENYQYIGDPIGWGQYSHVWLAQDLKKERQVAIKSSSHLNIAKKESSVMKTYGTHPLLPQFYDFFIIDNRAYIVMEYFPGETIGHSNYYHKGKKRNIQEALLITLNILKGVQHLHNKGFAHSDLLPKNILIMKNDPKKIKIIDFGLARPIEKIKYKYGDINAIVRMCIYLISGYASENPFNDKDDQNNLELIDDKLKKALYKAVHPEEKNRYQSCEEFIDNLKTIM